MIVRQYETIINPKSPPPAAVDGTWGWENLDEVKPQAGDTIVKKYRTDSFLGTNLDHVLRWNGIRTIVILGAGAEAGIVPTVTHAFNLGYFVVAVGDCIRPTEPAWLDDAMKFIARSAIVKTHTEIIQGWRAGPAL
jgi:nicotinamidase-related amidase